MSLDALCRDSTSEILHDPHTKRLQKPYEKTLYLLSLSCCRIMTGSSNGQLKVWSYNSGECLKTLDKGENTGST